MTLIDGDRIVTAQLYDDQHEEFMEKKISIIDFVNAYTDEGVTTADDVLDKIRAEIEEQKECRCFDDDDMYIYKTGLNDSIDIIDKYEAESEDKE